MNITDPTFPELSFAELKEARKLLEAEMVRRVAEEQKRLQAEIKAKAAEYGVTVEELMGKPLAQRQRPGRKPQAPAPEQAPEVKSEKAAVAASESVVAAVAQQIAALAGNNVLSVAENT